MNGRMQTRKVLICATTGRDGPLLQRYLLKDEIQSVCYESIERLAEALDGSVQAVIIAEETLVPRGVEQLFTFLKNQPPWSDVTVILLTNGSEESSQVSSGLVHLFGVHGNVNMLERPVRVPTLITTGAEDILVPPASSVALHALISGSEIVTIPDAGHLHFIEQAQLFNEVCLGFLQKHRGA